MEKDTGSSFVLAGHNGYIGSLIFKILSSHSVQPVRTITRADLGSISKNELGFGGRIILINAIGQTQSSSANYSEILRELHLANVQSVQDLLLGFQGIATQIIHISSSLLNEPSLIEESYYLGSKYQAEVLINSRRQQSRTVMTIMRIPSIWSTNLTKPNSLLEFFRYSPIPFDSNTLRNRNQICHIAPEETLRSMLQRTIGNNKDELVLPFESEFLRTTAGNMAKLLNQTSLNFNNSAIERRLYQIAGIH